MAALHRAMRLRWRGTGLIKSMLGTAFLHRTLTDIGLSLVTISTTVINSRFSLRSCGYSLAKIRPHLKLLPCMFQCSPMTDINRRWIGTLSLLNRYTLRPCSNWKILIFLKMPEPDIVASSVISGADMPASNFHTD
jgi:hypothetical protein